MPGPVRRLDPPSVEEIRSLADDQFLDPSEAEATFIHRYAIESQSAYHRLDQLVSGSTKTSDIKRDPGKRATDDSDPYNAFVRHCHVSGPKSGPLSGYDIGLKDNIAVAGIETTYGTPLMAGYVPDADATVVTRLLDSGATITGKLTMSPLSFSDGFHDHGRNPHDPSRNAGGSSTGSAIAVVTEDVDVALGVDQGGSIRQPAAWCGCLGLKPTHGLVPFTGIQSMDDTLDHVGPMTRSVADCALTLETIAGPDPQDPRQRVNPDGTTYTEILDRDLADVTVGVLEEGFTGEDTNTTVLGEVSEAIDRLGELGASIVDVSVPMHDDGPAIWQAIFNEGMAKKIGMEGLTPFTLGDQDVRFARAFGSRRRVNGDDIPLRIKAAMVFGAYLGERYQHRYYAHAQNLASRLTSAYDDAFEEVDALALPTWPDIAPKLPSVSTERDAIDVTADGLDRVAESSTNQFNVSGHPALTVPCGTVQSLPVGLQLVGPHFREDVLLQIAAAYEHAFGWSARLPKSNE